MRPLCLSSCSDVFNFVSTSKVFYLVLFFGRFTDEREYWVFPFFLPFCKGSRFLEFLFWRRQWPLSFDDSSPYNCDVSCVPDCSSSMTLLYFCSITFSIWVSVALPGHSIGACVIAIGRYRLSVRMIKNASDWESRLMIFQNGFQWSLRGPIPSTPFLGTRKSTIDFHSKELNAELKSLTSVFRWIESSLPSSG